MNTHKGKPIRIVMEYVDKLKILGRIYTNEWVLKINYGNMYVIGGHAKRPNKRVIREATKMLKREAHRRVRVGLIKPDKLKLKEYRNG